MSVSMETIEGLTKQLDSEFEPDPLLTTPHPYTLSVVKASHQDFAEGEEGEGEEEDGTSGEKAGQGNGAQGHGVGNEVSEVAI